MNQDRVRDWMTRDPITISSHSKLPEAYRLMLIHEVRRLLVVDQGVLVGVITLEDVRRKMPDSVMDSDPVHARQVFALTKVSEIMAKNPKTIPVDATLTQASRLMLEYHISTLPVMSGNRLVGIITESDIFEAMVKVFVVQ